MSKAFIVSVVLGLLTSCASYKPIVDTAGRSGTFDEDKAKEISNDLQHCKQLAKDNTSVMSNISFWFLSPTAQTPVSYTHLTLPTTPYV